MDARMASMPGWMDPMLMDEGTKVALVYKEGSAGSARVAKVWWFFGRIVETYTLTKVKKDFLEYFPEIAAKNLGLNVYYHDSFVGFISIDSDKDLQVKA